jgi:hypothetical protein
MKNRYDALLLDWERLVHEVVEGEVRKQFAILPRFPGVADFVLVFPERLRSTLSPSSLSVTAESFIYSVYE